MAHPRLHSYKREQSKDLHPEPPCRALSLGVLLLLALKSRGTGSSRGEETKAPPNSRPLSPASRDWRGRGGEEPMFLSIPLTYNLTLFGIIRPESLQLGLGNSWPAAIEPTPRGQCAESPVPGQCQQPRSPCDQTATPGASASSFVKGKCLWP